jgi:micrococcal nuclease
VEEPAPPIWVEASGTLCPETHPIKAKLSSRIFHLPGMLAYDRTRPDRCYGTEEAADADGFTKAKR